VTRQILGCVAATCERGVVEYANRTNIRIATVTVGRIYLHYVVNNFGQTSCIYSKSNPTALAARIMQTRLSNLDYTSINFAKPLSWLQQMAGCLKFMLCINCVY